MQISQTIFVVSLWQVLQLVIAVEQGPHESPPGAGNPVVQVSHT